jgi:hypothetical protein
LVEAIEFHGRLQRSDGRPVNPGRYDLLFRLHTGLADDGATWTEQINDVAVAAGGFFHVVLGRQHPIRAQLFDHGGTWLSVQVVRDGRPAGEVGERIPLSGGIVRLGAAVAELERQVADLGGGETIRLPTAPAPADEDLQLLRRRTLKLHRRLQALEAGRGAVGTVGDRVAELESRLLRVDGEDGRVMRIEDELEDIVGPDGDVVDLLERMDRIEGRAPELLANLARHRPPLEEPGAAARAKVLGDALAAIERRVAALEARPPAPTLESLGGVKRTGDNIYGKLVVQKGGIDVISGGIKARGAHVNTLDVEHVVSTGRLVAGGIELRGELTLDGTHRHLQVRHVEGRSGAGRKDGELHLNARAGAEVVVGNAQAQAGLTVHGVVRTGGLHAGGRGLCERFDCDEPLRAGEVACAGGRSPRTVERSTAAYDVRVVGVVGPGAGLSLGDGKIEVVIAGTAKVRVVGPVRTGDLLVSSGTAGHAMACKHPERARGTVLGKALTSHGRGKGEAWILVSPR